MLRRDARSLITREPGHALLATCISLGLHGAALAGLLLFREVEPPKPHAVIAVELVHDADVLGPLRGKAGEEAAASTAKQEPAFADREHIADPDEPADAGAGDDEPASSELAATPVPKPKRVSTQSVETASAPEDSAEAMRPVPPAPRRKPPPPDSRDHAKASIAETALEPARMEQAPPRPPERTSARDGAQSAAHRQEAVMRAATRDRAVAALPASVPGGGFAGTPPRYAGRGLSNAPPRYPYLARRRGQEGRAVLRVQVTADGQAAAVRLHETSGYRLLDEAALAAIKAWRFTPAKRGGLSVAGSVDVPISFKLED